MTRLRTGLWIAALLLVACFVWMVLAGSGSLPASAQAPGGDVNTYIANTPIKGLPQGPYSQWNEEQRKVAYQRIGGFCQFLCVDSYGSIPLQDRAAAERGKLDAKVCFGACVVNHLPDDFPELAALKQQLHADYDTAKKGALPQKAGRRSGGFWKMLRRRCVVLDLNAGDSRNRQLLAQWAVSNIWA